MHVALCTQQFGNYWSGLGSYATILAKGLAERGVKLTIISPGEPISEIDAEFIHVNPSSMDPTHGGWFSLAKAYQRELKKIRPDIVHFSDARESYGYSGSVPAVGTLHDDYFARHRWRPWFYKKHYADWLKRYAYYSFVTCTERKALRKLHGLIANSNCTAETISSRYSINQSKIQTIYIQPDLGVNPIDSAIEQARMENMTLLFVGGNIQRKGLPLVFKALQYLHARFPDLKLRILGKNQNMEKMQRLARKMGIENSVFFQGWVHPTEVSKFYRESTAFIMPSLMEGYGLVYLEAMAQGLPVIAGDVGGSRELIKDKQNGLLVNPHNEDDLVKSIELLLTDRPLRETLIAGGASTVEKLNIEQMIDETNEYYHRTLKNL